MCWQSKLHHVDIHIYIYIFLYIIIIFSFLTPVISPLYTPTYFLPVSPSFNSSPALPSILPQVRVVIVDENDCVPEFLQSIYSKDGVPETVTTATSLLQGETSHAHPKKPLFRIPSTTLHHVLSCRTPLSALFYIFVKITSYWLSSSHVVFSFCVILLFNSTDWKYSCNAKFWDILIHTW